jgi:hypothetical protein
LINDNDVWSLNSLKGTKGDLYTRIEIRNSQSILEKIRDRK